MILDSTAKIGNYAPLHPGISKIAEFLDNPDWAKYTPGRYEIDGENLFFLVSEYSTKEFSPDSWEAHRKYIDIQTVVSGKEYIYHNLLEEMQTVEGYSIEKDFIRLSGEGQGILLRPGTFLLLFPNDAHQPGCRFEAAGSPVKKCVFKLKVENS